MSGPLPAPSSSGVRITGDHYQWLIAWQQCVRVIYDEQTGAPNPVLRVGVEVGGAGNLDDVVVYRRDPPVSFNQVKYAVDARTPVNTAFLTEKAADRGSSVLKKIADSWRQLTASGEVVDLGLITNRAPDPGDVLIVGCDARTHLLLPKGSEGGPTSAKGRARAAWAVEADLTEGELLELLGVLRFDLSRDLMQQEEIAALTMVAAGLRGDQGAVALGAEWVAQQVRDGRRSLDHAAIEAAVKALSLRAGPVRTIVSVATLKPDPLSDRARYSLDWVDRFEGDDAFEKRRPKSPASWTELQSEIEAIPGNVEGATDVLVTGSLRQATAFDLGAAFRMVTGIDIAINQRGQVWSSDAPYQAPESVERSIDQVDQGPDLAVVVAVATSITKDVLAYVREHNVPVRQVLTLSPSNGPNDNYVTSDTHANALSVGLRDAVREEVRGYSSVHLFLAGPLGLALFLGHRWNRVAPTVVYEDLNEDGYEAAFTVIA